MAQEKEAILDAIWSAQLEKNNEDIGNVSN